MLGYLTQQNGKDLADSKLAKGRLGYLIQILSTHGLDVRNSLPCNRLFRYNVYQFSGDVYSLDHLFTFDVCFHFLTFEGKRQGFLFAD